MPYRKPGTPINFQRLGEIADELDEAETERRRFDEGASATISLECSKKVYELLGDTYETESGHCRERIKSIWHPWFISKGTWPINHSDFERVPAPSFSELIRLLPKIAEKKGWPPYPIHPAMRSPVTSHTADELAWRFLYWYMQAPTENEGMERVSEYLEKII